MAKDGLIGLKGERLDPPKEPPGGITHNQVIRFGLSVITVLLTALIAAWAYIANDKLNVVTGIVAKVEKHETRITRVEDKVGDLDKRTLRVEDRLWGRRAELPDETQRP